MPLCLTWIFKKMQTMTSNQAFAEPRDSNIPAEQNYPIPPTPRKPTKSPRMSYTCSANTWGVLSLCQHLFFDVSPSSKQ